MKENRTRTLDPPRWMCPPPSALRSGGRHACFRGEQKNTKEKGTRREDPTLHSLSRQSPSGLLAGSQLLGRGLLLLLLLLLLLMLMLMLMMMTTTMMMMDDDDER